MATVNAACSEIIDKVNTSGLDYSINLTPYSIHLSIRKKFSRISSTTLRSPSSTTSSKCINQSDLLRQELLNTINEYAKLFNFYTSEMEVSANLKLELLKETENKSKIEAELAVALEKLNLKEENRNATKQLKVENRKLQETCENKSLELKHLKMEIENLKKEKNSISVALKGSKQEVKEHAKAFAREKNLLETKICELNDFRTKKLNEEREEKSRKRKEVKKANRKQKVVESLENSIHDKVEQEADINEIKSDDEGDKVDDNSNKKAVPDENTKVEEVEVKQVEEATVDLAKNVKTKTDPNGNLDRKASTENIVDTEDVVVDENAEGFIGPKLPPRMTKEEIATFYEEMMAKFKLDDL